LTDRTELARPSDGRDAAPSASFFGDVDLIQPDSISPMNFMEDGAARRPYQRKVHDTL
jgi:hypothetical protein